MTSDLITLPDEGRDAAAFLSDGRGYLSVTVTNTGRSAATIRSVSLQAVDTDEHVPLGFAVGLGQVTGPRCLAQGGWSLTRSRTAGAVEPFITVLQRDKRSTTVRAFTEINGKKKLSNQTHLIDIARLNG